MITMTLGQLLRQKLEMSIDITYQKKVADAYLKSIEMISPRAIIAGGCVSDWHLGRAANDIDIFLTLPAGISTKDMKTMLYAATCGHHIDDLTVLTLRCLVYLKSLTKRKGELSRRFSLLYVRIHIRLLMLFLLVSRDAGVRMGRVTSLTSLSFLLITRL